MKLARSEPLKALPVAEKWHAEGGGLAARHCVAVAMFEAGRYSRRRRSSRRSPATWARIVPACAPSCGPRPARPMEAGCADKAAEAQSRALELKANDADLWVDRGLSYAAMRAWPRAISDFDRALILRPNDVEILVLRAAAWRNAGNPARALDDAARALRIAPDHSEALLERGFASLARGDAARPTTTSARCCVSCRRARTRRARAEAGLRGEQPPAAAPAAPPPPAVPPKGGGKR